MSVNPIGMHYYAEDGIVKVNITYDLSARQFYARYGTIEDARRIIQSDDKVTLQCYAGVHQTVLNRYSTEGFAESSLLCTSQIEGYYSLMSADTKRRIASFDKIDERFTDILKQYQNIDVFYRSIGFGKVNNLFGTSEHLFRSSNYGTVFNFHNIKARDVVWMENLFDEKIMHQISQHLLTQAQRKKVSYE